MSDETPEFREGVAGGPLKKYAPGMWSRHREMTDAAELLARGADQHETDKTRAVGETLDDPTPEDVQRELDEALDRIVELVAALGIADRKLAGRGRSAPNMLERAGRGLLTTAAELHAEAVVYDHHSVDDSTGRADELDAAATAARDLGLDCLRAAWGSQ